MVEEPDFNTRRQCLTRSIVSMTTQRRPLSSKTAVTTTTTSHSTTHTRNTTTVATTTELSPLHTSSLPQLPPPPMKVRMVSAPLSPSSSSSSLSVMRTRQIPVRMSFARRTWKMIVLFSCTKLLLLVPLYTAEKDSNPYPYGNNPNNQFKMYWNDAANVLQDLSKFSALFIKYHGCVWSECHVDQFDDDGENRDGGTCYL